MTGETCAWCGDGVDPDDGWRAGEPAGERRAAFCRLEHVFPWWARGPFWDAGRLREPDGLTDSLTRRMRLTSGRQIQYALKITF